jgi:hypothetical protein
MFEFRMLLYFMSLSYYVIEYEHDGCTALLFYSFLVQLAFLDAFPVCNLTLFVKQ